MASQGQCRRVKGKLEGSPLGRAKQGYSSPIYAEVPDLFPLSTSKSYSRRDFSENYGLGCSGINPKHLKAGEDYMDEDLCKFLGPVVNKNGHRYMFLRNEETVRKLELLWMQIHQKHCLLSSRVISLGMARGFYCQEKMNCNLNWAAYAEWTNSEQLRRRQKAMKQGRSPDDAFLSDDEDGSFVGEDGGSSGSKTFSQLESPSRQESFSSGYEVWGDPSARLVATEAWKSYGLIIGEEQDRTVITLTSERKAKEEFTVADARSKGQMEFCLEKLSNALEKLDSLHELRDYELKRISESGRDVEMSSSLLDSLSADVEAQKKLLSLCETWASDSQSRYLKLRESESGVASRVSELEERMLKLDRHVGAVKTCIARLEFGSNLFRTVPPQPISNLRAPHESELLELHRCAYCGLGFEPVWAVSLGSCKCVYHLVCCRIHFQDFTVCSGVNCEKEMHADWWAAHGIVKPGTKQMAVEVPRTKTRPTTIPEVPESPCNIHRADDEVAEGLDWTLKSNEVVEGGISVPTTSPIVSASTLDLCVGSKERPSCTTKSIVTGDSPTRKGTSDLQVNSADHDKSEVSHIVLETQSVLEGSHMRGQNSKGKNPASKNGGAVTREEGERLVDSALNSIEDDDEEDECELDNTVGDEVSETDGEEGEQENEVLVEEEFKVDEVVNEKRKKRKKGGTKRKGKANPRMCGGGNAKRKKLPVESRKLTASNTRAAARTGK